MSEPAGSESHEPRMAFGYAIMGPILADMLRQLYSCLRASPSPPPVVFFCSRGGLVLRRTLDLFAHSVGLELGIQCQDFMVSRLAAFRPAFQLDPAAVAPLIEIEFAGRTCAEAIRALANIEVDGDGRWNAPFSVARLSELMESTEPGRRMRDINDRQADFLRRYIDALRGANRRVVLCDTGVFGSIARYLQVGVPAVDWHMALLFRANYKHISAPHFKSTVGVVSEANVYLPWQPVTAALRYWQLIEAMLEPAVPSVRFYRYDCAGQVVSDLELAGWQARLEPPAGSLLAGACSYLRQLTPESLPSLHSHARTAWRQLRRRIIFPSMEDVLLLAVGRRNYDFGMDDSVEFTGGLDKAGRSLREKLSAAGASIWREGELRKQFPRAAGLFQLTREISQSMQAFNHEWFLRKTHWLAWISRLSGKTSP
jgi:hypothetical protein